MSLRHSIPFLDIQKVNSRYKKQLTHAVAEVLSSPDLILGKEVCAFESEYAAFTNTSHCVGVGSGLDAIILTFKALIVAGRLKAGDEVIVPANTYIASILGITHAGLVPIPVEPDLATFNLNPLMLEAGITTKTRAILVVHLYGQIAEMETILAFAKQHSLIVVEDCAQSHGATRFERVSGSFGHVAAHSFYPTKNLGGAGDSGAVTTNDEEIANWVNILRNYGSDRKYVHVVKGFNSRMDEVQAAILRIKMRFLEADNGIRRMLATRYLTEITNKSVILPEVLPGNVHAWHLFVIRCLERDKLKNFLSDNGIGTMVHYPIPPHRQQAYSEWSSNDFPVTDQIHREVLSLPLNPALNDEEVSTIIEAVNNF
jgi:dTDP-4-amino-4,6-dideoxygalactose transaminase